MADRELEVPYAALLTYRYLNRDPISDEDLRDNIRRIATPVIVSETDSDD